MKGLIVAAAAALGLAGCVAVPAPYGPDAYYPDAYYYPAPAVGVGIYAAPYRYHHRHHHQQRHWRR